MSNYTYIPISNLQLVFSVSLVLITGLISALLKLGLLKSLIWGTIRAFVQLTLIGYVLTYIFALNNLIIIATVILFMCFVASREATRRVKNFPHQSGKQRCWHSGIRTIIYHSDAGNFLPAWLLPDW
ncbi:MAG TPA: ABC transporter permease [Gelria sp.]|nr:ABC transporter permease [Gelria sp.]